MTETVTETPVKQEPTFSSPMEKMQFEGLEEFIKDYNDLVGKINAATGDKDALAEQIAKEKFADELAEIVRLQEALDAKVDVEVEKALTSDQGDMTEITEKAKDLKGKIGAGINYFKKLYGDASAEKFTKQERLKGQRVGGTGTGTRRIRGFRVTVTQGEDVQDYENFASAAKALGATTSELQEWFFAKASATDLSEIGNVVEFDLNWKVTAEDGTESDASATVKCYREVPIVEDETSESVPDDEDAPEPEVEDEGPSDSDLQQIG